MTEQVLNLLRDNLPLIVMFVVLGVGFFLLRTKSTKLDSENEFEAMLSTGKPVVVEFFSNT